jgi:hypothetical protein
MKEIELKESMDDDADEEMVVDIGGMKLASDKSKYLK